MIHIFGPSQNLEELAPDTNIRYTAPGLGGRSFQAASLERVMADDDSGDLLKFLLEEAP